MALELRNDGSPLTFVSEPLELRACTWWFWLKAGMGFTLGAGLVSMIAVAIGWIFTLVVVGGAGMLFRPR